MIRTLYALWKDRKAVMDIPGWAYVIALILGLFLLLFAIYMAAKSGQKQSGLLEQI